MHLHWIMASKKQSDLIKKWRERGFFVINLIVISPTGIPDLVCLKPNHVVFVESKEKGDILSPLQRVWHKRLVRMGFDVYLNEEKINL